MENSSQCEPMTLGEIADEVVRYEWIARQIPQELTMHPLRWENEKASWSPSINCGEQPEVLGLRVCLDSEFPFGVVLVS